MAFRQRRNELPAWLWFFLILPLGLIVMLLWRFRDQRFALARFRQPGGLPVGKRYTEPDSIPIDTRLPAAPLREPGEGAEDAVQAKGTAQSEMSGREVWLDETPVNEASAATGEPDDLTIIEGIGPSIARLLGDRNIKTFRLLAATPVSQLREILASARLQHLADPGTWPEQARMAALGQWDALKTLQDSLKGGRRASQA